MSRNTEATDDVKTWTGGPLNYKEGFFTQLATDELAKGINEEVVRAISAKRNEPEWMLEFRLNAYHAWLEMEEPHWLKAHYDKLNYQDYSYYSAPSCGNCDDNCASEPGAVQQTGANAFLSKEVEAAFEQLGVPVREGKEVAVDFIRNTTEADGIISTRQSFIRRAKELGLAAILRVFLLDSIALESLDKIPANLPDCLDLLPGTMPKILRRVCATAKVPVLTGGLIADKEDVLAALEAGVTAISTTNQAVWDM